MNQRSRKMGLLHFGDRSQNNLKNEISDLGTIEAHVNLCLFTMFRLQVPVVRCHVDEIRDRDNFKNEPVSKSTNVLTEPE